MAAAPAAPAVAAAVIVVGTGAAAAPGRDEEARGQGPARRSARARADIGGAPTSAAHAACVAIRCPEPSAIAPAAAFVSVAADLYCRAQGRASPPPSRLRPPPHPRARSWRGVTALPVRAAPADGDDAQGGHARWNDEALLPPHGRVGDGCEGRGPGGGHPADGAACSPGQRRRCGQDDQRGQQRPPRGPTLVPWPPCPPSPAPRPILSHVISFHLPLLAPRCRSSTGRVSDAAGHTGGRAIPSCYGAGISPLLMGAAPARHA